MRDDSAAPPFRCAADDAFEPCEACAEERPREAERPRVGRDEAAAARAVLGEPDPRDAVLREPDPRDAALREPERLDEAPAPPDAARVDPVRRAPAEDDEPLRELEAFPPPLERDEREAR